MTLTVRGPGLKAMGGGARPTERPGVRADAIGGSSVGVDRWTGSAVGVHRCVRWRERGAVGGSAACADLRPVRTVGCMPNTSKAKAKAHSVHFSSKTDNWPTPIGFFNRLDAEFNFGLDVCADKANTKTGAYYGLDHQDPARRDALLCNWASDARGQSVWMNPPYGKNGIKQFMAKAVATAKAGVTVVCLVPARPDTQWWHASVFEADVDVEVRFVKGRLKFGAATASAPFPSAVIVLGPRADGTVKAMPSRAKALPLPLPLPQAQLSLFPTDFAVAA